MTFKFEDKTPQQWIDADNKFVWHPFTPMKQWMEQEDHTGRVIVEADGFELIDQQGNRFVDGFSSLWCNLHGHRVKQVDQAVIDQLGKIAHCTMLGHASLPSIRLAEQLVEISPAGLEKVFYSDSGATAVEVGLKMAYQYFQNIGKPGKSKFIALRNSYHGDTIGSVSLGGIGLFHKIFNKLLFEATFIDSPCEYYHPAGAGAKEAVLNQLETLLAEHADEYCALIIEPLMQGAAGMLNHPAGFLSAVREITRKYNVLLICDEVATGFGSTGKLFACDHENVSPDIMTLGKKITNGYLPIAATLTTQAIFDGFLGEVSEGKTFYHGHTFTGNALGCAAAVASIDLIKSSALEEKLPGKVKLIEEKIAPLKDHPNVGSIRQVGLMVGIELVASDSRPFDPASRTGAEVCFNAREKGVIIRPLGDVIVLMPAPAMDDATLTKLLDVTVETICEFFQS